MTTRGAVYIAYGLASQREVVKSISAFRKFSYYPVAIVGNEATLIHDVTNIHFDSIDAGGRWAKLNLDTLSPYAQTMYMDADTRMLAGCANVGFQILSDGYDLVIAPSENQGGQLLAHSTIDDRDATLEAVENPLPLQLQAGVFWFAKNQRTTELFKAWREEWGRFKDQDQGALLRALERVPVHIWLLGFDWNSRHGELIEHLFGRARA